LGLEFDHEAAVGGVDLGAGRRHIAGQLAVARQLTAEIDESDRGERRDTDRAKHQSEESDTGDYAQGTHHSGRAAASLIGSAPWRFIATYILRDGSAMSPSQLTPALRAQCE